MIDATINDRSRRLQHRLKQNALHGPNTNDAKKLKNMTKKARLVASPVVGKEKMGCSLECSDDDNTSNLACDELVSVMPGSRQTSCGRTSVMLVGTIEMPSNR